MKQIYLATVTALLFISSAHAAEIPSDVRVGSGSFDNSDGGYFEFGVGLNGFANREGLIVNDSAFFSGAYRYRGFFFEASSPGTTHNDGSFGGIKLGFNIWRSDKWAVDLLGASARWRLSRQTLKVELSNSPNPALEQDLLDRRSFYNGAGVRLTGYFGNTIFQYRLVDDTHGRNGVTSSARVGYTQQAKNWNFHGVIGADYVSQETGQFWYGVSDEEASARFPSYVIRSSTITYSAEIGATLPIRENVVFRSTVRYTPFADAIAKSPLQEDEFELRSSTSISYVF